MIKDINKYNMNNNFFKRDNNCNENEKDNHEKTTGGKVKN